MHYDINMLLKLLVNKPVGTFGASFPSFLQACQDYLYLLTHNPEELDLVETVAGHLQIECYLW